MASPATHTALAPAGRPTTGYLPSLDGARALAIILVVLSHITSDFLWGGGLGVDLFFVLSGFLITGILLREEERTGKIRLRRFYLRRLVRLYPELLLVVAVMSLIFWFLISRRNLLLETLFALTYTSVFPFESGWVGQRIWAHTWTLSGSSHLRV